MKRRSFVSYDPTRSPVQQYTYTVPPIAYKKTVLVGKQACAIIRTQVVKKGARRMRDFSAKDLKRSRLRAQRRTGSLAARKPREIRLLRVAGVTSRTDCIVSFHTDSTSSLAACVCDLLTDGSIFKKICLIIYFIKRE
jgi:hypothetical protein